jgi:serine/threonine-protein kinase
MFRGRSVPLKPENAMPDKPARPAPRPSAPADPNVTQDHTEVDPAAAGPGDMDATQAHTDGPGDEAATEVAGKGGAPAPAPTPAKDPKSSMLGDFRLTKKLGEGGMGAVYKGRQDTLDRDVAVKVMSKKLGADQLFVQRFYREARIMAKLDHPNIVRCYHVGEDKGLHFLAMEFVDGGSIQDWLKKLGKFSLGDSLHIILACADALQHAHELDLVHRDIKPDNILLTKKGVVKVADLGLAKGLSEELSLTRTGTGAGTPYYMALEQAKDAKHVDGRCDIYSLGCMLYVFLTGELPFRGETTLELFKAKEAGKFEPARRHNAEVPERLDLILDKMLAKNPDHRYRTCAEVIADLEALGLANPALSFLTPAGEAKPGARGAPAPRPAAAGTRPTGRPVLRGPTGPAVEEEEPEFWYARYKGPDGKQVTRKMTETELIGLIKSEKFDPDTQLSRHLKDGYRDLATYRQFEPLLRARMSKARADKKAAKFRSMYEKIEQEEKTYQRWRWIRRKFRSAGGLLSLVVWLAILAGVGYLGYWAVKTYLIKSP